MTITKVFLTFLIQQWVTPLPLNQAPLYPPQTRVVVFLSNRFVQGAYIHFLAANSLRLTSEFWGQYLSFSDISVTESQRQQRSSRVFWRAERVTMVYFILLQVLERLPSLEPLSRWNVFTLSWIWQAPRPPASSHLGHLPLCPLPTIRCFS